MKKLLALDFGGTLVKYGLVDPEGIVSGQGEVSAPLGSLSLFQETVKAIYDSAGEEICGLAISLPGIVDSQSGRLHTAGAYTPILGGRNIHDLLPFAEEPVSVENDGNCAALAEAWRGALKGARSGAALIIGSSLGGGLVYEGKLLRGAHGISMELGCLMTAPGLYEKGQTAAYRAGTTALLTAVADVKGLPREQFEIAGVNRYAGEGGATPLYTGRDVFRWIEEGDPQTCRVYSAWLDALVFAVYSLRMVVDPERIVIGGGISRSARLLPDLCERYERTKVLSSVAQALDCSIGLCRFSSEANLVGAACTWMEHYGAQAVSKTKR